MYPCHKALGHASNNLEVSTPEKKTSEFCFFCINILISIIDSGTVDDFFLQTSVYAGKKVTYVKSIFTMKC
jgi:hypothetical protein